MHSTEHDVEHQLVCDAVAKMATGELKTGDIRGEMLLSRDLGIDSLQFIRLILEIEAKISRKIFNVQLISQIKTVHDLCTAVAGH
jgi:acyl carrier protein